MAKATARPSGQFKDGSKTGFTTQPVGKQPGAANPLRDAMTTQPVTPPRVKPDRSKSLAAGQAKRDAITAHKTYDTPGAGKVADQFYPSSDQYRTPDSQFGQGTAPAPATEFGSSSGMRGSIPQGGFTLKPAPKRDTTVRY